MANPIAQGQGDDDSNAMQTVAAQFIPGYCFSDENPVEKALSIHLILKEIFRHCVNGKDIKLLLAVRRVCKFWWKEASLVLNDYYDLLPVITTLPGYPWSMSTSLARFVETIKPHGVLPTGGFPLNLSITQWTPQTTQFLINSAECITRIELKIQNFEKLSLEERPFNLARLRYAAFSFLYDTNHYQGFQDHLVRFKDLIKDANNLKDCEVRLSLSDAPRASNDNASLIQLPRQLTLLKSRYRCFEQLASSQTWPKLKKLILTVPPGNDASLRPIHLTNKVSHLTYLQLVNWDRDPEEVELPRMPNLTRMVLRNVDIRGQIPLPGLLPQLKEVEVLLMGSLHVQSYLIRGELPNENVTQFNLKENATRRLDVPPNPDPVQRMTAFTKRFLNLVKLHWSARQDAIVSGAWIIFSNLEKLKILSIRIPFLLLEPAPEPDLLELITGLSREEIPEDEASWPESLVGRKNAITNLKCLEGFSLKLHAWNLQVIPERESRFLFQAAFNQTENLKFININSPDLNEEARAEWVARGNVFDRDGGFVFPEFVGYSLY